MGKYIPDTEIYAELESLLVIAEKKFREWIPEDTFDLQNDTKIDRPRREWLKIVASVYTDPNGESQEYAEFVHYGTFWEKKYYKNSGRRNGGTPFLVSSQWTQYATKTIRYLEDNVI